MYLKVLSYVLIIIDAMVYFLLISVMHNLELEANKLYDRANKLCKVALMTMYYVLHFTSPYIYSVVNHIDITCNDTIPFNNKGIEFINLHSIFKHKSMVSSVPKVPS